MKTLRKFVLNRRSLALAGGLLLLTQTASAVVFISTGDPNHNTSAPTGSLLNSGWQYEGQWGGFLGTAISPYHFITANHVGGSVGQDFVLNGVHYPTISSTVSPNSDLRIWQVSTPLPLYAPLYTGSGEVGQSLVVFGRGAERGGEVRNAQNDLCGWYWGAGNYTQRWGENVVGAVVDGGASLGQLLQATFDFSAGGNEAHLSGGDSGGGMFIQDGGIWKLAGINYGVDGSFSITGQNGTGFNAAIFDAGGLFYGKDGNWNEIQNQSYDIPSAFYSTRISANQTWIMGVVPEPTAWMLVSGGLLLAYGLARRNRV